jgi:hypothetical protein
MDLNFNQIMAHGGARQNNKPFRQNLNYNNQGYKLNNHGNNMVPNQYGRNQGN